MSLPRTVLAVLLILGLPGAAPPSASSDEPVARPAVAPPITDLPIANPGVIHDGRRWVVFSTRSWSRPSVIATATRPQGPWTSTTRRLLTKQPVWASKHPGDRFVWAPSVVRSTRGTYVVFYSALLRHDSLSRCIGAGTSTSPLGPFRPTGRPIACFAGSGTKPQDRIRSEGTNFKLIDATPAVIGTRYYLTYKTSKRLVGGWHSTTRVVRLDPAHPTRTTGRSTRITDWRNKEIEENPVLVRHGDTFTLFTSRGFYGRCTGPYAYRTVYRQATTIAGLARVAPRRLSFPTARRSCGTGNAQVVAAASGGGWRIFWNGRIPRGSDPEGPFRLYTGKVTWPGGRPAVTQVYRRPG